MGRNTKDWIALLLTVAVLAALMPPIASLLTKLSDQSRESHIRLIQEAIRRERGR